jgi:exosortase/archaeosortase family protein
LQVAAFWPVWPWYWRRLTDRCDEPWGVVALLAAAVFVMQRARLPEAASGRLRASLLPALALTVLYAVVFPFVPPLIRAWVAVSALTASVSVGLLACRFHVGLWGLLTLSLPVMLSFEFYAGYPLRVLTTWLAAVLVTLAGIPVHAAGAALEWQGGLVAVDAPCAGIRMLWTGAFLTLVLACFRNLRFGRTLVAGVLAAGMVLAGNVVRTASLFYIESGILPAPAWLHVAIGLAAFTVTGVSILLIVSWLGGRNGGASRADEGGAVQAEEGRALRYAMGVLLAAALGAAAVVPVADGPGVGDCAGFPGWPAVFEGHALRALPLTDVERRFEREFPGRLGRFTDGERTIVLRWVARPSRQLHPAETCFKALGFAIHPTALERDPDGRLWSTFRAQRASESLRVRTLIYDTGGRSWQDVSSWFWAASLGRSEGPWWAVTVAERGG